MVDVPHPKESPKESAKPNNLAGAVTPKDVSDFIKAGFFMGNGPKDPTVAFASDGSIEFKSPASQTSERPTRTKTATPATDKDQGFPGSGKDAFAPPKTPEQATKDFLEAKDEKGNLKNVALISESNGQKTYQLKDGTKVVKTSENSGYVLAAKPGEDGYQKMQTFGPNAENCMTAGVKQTDKGWDYKYEYPSGYLAHINKDKTTGYVTTPVGKDGGFSVQHFGHNIVGDNYSEHHLADGTYVHEPATILTKTDYDKILEIHSSAKPEFVQQAKREIDQYFAQSSRADIDRFVASDTRIVLGQSMRALAADGKGREKSTFQKALGIENVNSTIGTAANPGTWADTEAAYNAGNKKIVLTQEYGQANTKSDRIGQVVAEQMDRACGVQRSVQRGADQSQPNADWSYPGETEYDKGVIDWVNHYRAQHGLHPLRPDGPMAYAASIAASNQATMHGLSHDHYGAQPGWQTPAQRLASVGRASPFGYLENAYMGPYDAKYTVDRWMNSPGHVDCILNPSATVIGVAYRTGQYGGYSTMSVGCVPAVYYQPTQIAMRQ